MKHVFPACAGMFLYLMGKLGAQNGFPRVRGDVPSRGNNPITQHLFSPRARGCSVYYRKRLRRCAVFPACAGMFLLGAAGRTAFRRFPRVRGDVPQGTNLATHQGAFSPRARGCSRGADGAILAADVFPACAGMFLTRGAEDTTRPGFPRVRGDVPHPTSPQTHVREFSPRARGCSYTRPPRTASKLVFPACAGMFLSVMVSIVLPASFPRVRGDVPLGGLNGAMERWFSPRARGCSEVTEKLRQAGIVFPACAGMFLLLEARNCPTCRFPRVRGDVPNPEAVKIPIGMFSPRARGCSL